MDDINNREPEKAEDSHVIVMHALSDARNSAATLNLPMNPRAKLNGPKKYGIQAKESKMDRKKYCCCFYTRSGCLSLVVLAGLGVAVFLLYPRIPTIKVGKPFFPGGAFGLQYNISSRGTVDTITYPISVNFTVDSQNYIDIACSEITVKGNMLDVNRNPIENAFANGVAREVVFKSFANTTSTIVIDFGYKSVSENPTQDLAVSTIYNAAQSKPLGKLSLGYEISVSLYLISWTGWKHRIQGEIDFSLEEYYPNGDTSQLTRLLDAMFKQTF